MMEIKKLGQICKLRQGFQVPLPEQLTEKRDGYVRFIRIVDYTQRNEDIRYVKDDSKYYYVTPNDIVMVRYGAAGEVGHGISGVIANNMFLIDPIVEINKDYLFYFLSQSRIRDSLRASSTSTTMPALNFKIVNELKIPIWNIEKQNEIVLVLDKLSGIIHKRETELDQLNELIKARFVEMFGEPIDNPMNWPVKKMKELSSLITNGNTPKGGSENYVDQGIVFLRSQNVWRNRIDLSDVAYIDEETHRKLRKSSVHHNDILITKTGRINTENSSLGRAALYTGEDNSANINGHVYLIRLNKEVDPRFVVTILTGEAYRKYIRKVCVGGIDKRQINLDQVEDFPIILPPLELQVQFSEFVEQVDKSKVVVKKSLNETQLLLDNLMQEYFG